jgi:hypothetical protein
MNSWQQGYDLELLKGLKKVVQKDYKPYVFGAFGMPNERDIATALSKGQVLKTKENDTIAIYQQYVAKSRITDFTQNSFNILPGWTFIKHLAGTQKAKLLNYFIENVKTPLLIEIFDEDSEVKELVESLGFKYITTKIAASSDLKGIYSRGVDVKYELQDGEEINIKEISKEFLTLEELEQIRKELQSFTSWADHYSSYNKRQSWSAFAIRGYDAADPNFIIKPHEMSQKWKQENEPRLKDKSEWTVAADKFPFTKKLVEAKFGGSVPDRVRFMRLTKGKGELARHADITDREAGIQPGKVVRLHIPIYTNPNVIFNSWTHKGERTVVNMSEGSLWYLDVRKPHTAVNQGEEDRIHLVMDFYASEQLSSFIKTPKIC